MSAGPENRFHTVRMNCDGERCDLIDCIDGQPIVEGQEVVFHWPTGTQIRNVYIEVITSSDSRFVKEDTRAFIIQYHMGAPLRVYLRDMFKLDSEGRDVVISIRHRTNYQPNS